MAVTAFAFMSCMAAVGPGSEFLARHDMVWEVPPARWLEGIPLANGHIGALIWGDGAPLKITLDKYDAWETREYVLGEDDVTYAKLRQWVAEGKRKEAEESLGTQLHEGRRGAVPYPTRLPMPRLELEFPQPLTWGQARLRLETSVADISARCGDKPLDLSVFVHARRNLVAIRLTGESAPAVSLRVGLDHLDEQARNLLKNWGYPDPDVRTHDTGGTFHLTTPTGYEYAIAWEKRQAAAPDTVHLYLALLSNEDAPAPLEAAAALVNDAAAADGDTPGHESWWAEYWNRSFLTIPDARLESLYYIEMYKLACSSRPGGYPTTLQGLWTLDGGMPPWSGDYHLDMNIQETYWPIYTANRLELGEPLYRVFSACIPRWRDQAQQFFGFDGIWSGVSVGPRGERIFGYSAVQMWPGNAAWLTHHYWLHFLYSQDKDFLRDEALPIMRLAFLTYANLLEADDAGTLHIPLSNSPEWGEGSFEAFVRNPTCDIGLIHFLGNAILQANDVLGVEDDLTPRVRHVLEHLVPYPADNTGFHVAEGIPLTHSHRHHSQLMPVHPLGVVTLEGSDADRALIRHSLARIRLLGTGEWTGWAFPWMSLIASRAGYGNMAWQMLDIYANSFIKPNTFHVNGDPRIFGLTHFQYEPMTLEAGFAAAAGVMEMLLQSHNGLIRLFPTMPDRWHDAYFADLRAEGAFVLTAKHADGRTRFAEVRSEAGLTCRIHNSFAGPADLLDTATGSTTTLDGDLLAFDTVPGGRYLLYPAGNRPTDQEMTPTTFQRTPHDTNFYGLKRRPRF